MTGATNDRFVLLLDHGSDPLPGLSGAPIIRRRGQALSCGNAQVQMPADKLTLHDAISDGTLERWWPVIEWLKLQVGPGRILVLAPDDRCRELVLLGLARQAFSYGLVLPKAPVRLLTDDYVIFGNARVVLFASPEVEEVFRRLYVPRYDGLVAGQDMVLPKVVPGAPASAPGQGTGPRILLIAYFSGQARTVGVQRINYWHRQIPHLWPGAQMTLATATPWDSSEPGVVHVPDLGPANLISEDGRVPAWAAALVANERLNARSISTLSHFWQIALERHFEARDDHYDVVIISGNPFAVFDFAAWAKRRWYARVVLDYRDPFSNNPRMGYSPAARDYARYVEKGYNLQADLITVVNEDCVHMVEAREDTRVTVVKNGFDETSLPPAGPRWSAGGPALHFIHAGTIYPDRSPGHLIAGLEKAGHRFHHVGSTTRLDAGDQASPAVELHGTRPYAEVLDLISRADCGVVFIHENGFDTPTKLFDYMAYGLDILIVTSGPFSAGAAGALVEGIDRVYWASNTPEGIAEFLASYRPSGRRSGEATRSFSRAASTRVLLDEIGALLGDTAGTPALVAPVPEVRRDLASRKLFIVGSCVTRDAFEFVPHDHELCGYVCRTSFASAFSDRVFPLSLSELDSAGAMTSPFQKRMVEIDLRKGLAEQLRALEAGTTVLVDLIDERFQLVLWKGAIATHSVEMQRTDPLARFPDMALVMANSREHLALWEKGVERFAALVAERGLNVVLNAALWASIDNAGEPFPAAQLQSHNAHLLRMYDIFTSRVPCRRIDYDVDFISDAHHKWGRSPFHYDVSVYKCFMSGLDRALGRCRSARAGSS